MQTLCRRSHTGVTSVTVVSPDCKLSEKTGLTVVTVLSNDCELSEGKCLLQNNPNRLQHPL